MSTNLINIESDYEYVLGKVRGNVLNLQAQFGYFDWTREELYIIARELENTGKLFAEKQGLRETGTLINSTHAVVDDNHHINFFNNANKGSGFYAGHIEYGYHTRKGDFIPARPFMRPALYAVAESSKGMLQGALSRYLNNVIYGIGGNFQSLNQLEFGRAITQKDYTRVFYQQQSKGRGASSNTGRYTGAGLQSGQNKQSVFGQLAQNPQRMQMSLVRGKEGNENMHRFLTRSPTGRGKDVASTRRYQFYDKKPGRVGRPDEEKARRPTGVGSGRPNEGKARTPSGVGPGRPAKYSSPSQWPSKQPSNNPRGRPKIYSSPKEWPSRQKTGKPVGRPRKPKVQGPKRPRGRPRKVQNKISENKKKAANGKYNHHLIKRDISDGNGKVSQKVKKDTNQDFRSELSSYKGDRKSNYNNNMVEFARKNGYNPRADKDKVRKAWDALED